MAVVEVAELRKVYGGRPVVDGVSFTVADGEIFGILGPNGAGKTTTVECIEGLRRPDGGHIRVLDLDPQRDGARLRHVLAPSVATQLVGRVREPQTDALTPRELEILRLVADGASNQQAAQRLFISEATVKTHLLHTYQKLGVNDRAAAVAAAYNRRLLTPDDGSPW